MKIDTYQQRSLENTAHITAWLVYDEAEAKRNEHYIRLYFDECYQRNIQLHLLLIEKIEICILDAAPVIRYDGVILTLPTFAICRTINPILSQQLEYMCIPVFNNAFVSTICNHKMKTYQYMSAFGVQTMDTFWVRNAQAASGGAVYPFVIKPVDGKGGNHVFLVRNKKEYDVAAANLENRECVMQRVASDIGKDLRVYVIGKRIVMAMLRISEIDFRSNYCLGGNASVYELSGDERTSVEKIIGLFDFGLVGIDFVFHNGNIVFNEIEDVVGSRMVYALTKINIVAEYLDYILSVIAR